jgi:hypothetical protein
LQEAAGGAAGYGATSRVVLVFERADRWIDRPTVRRSAPESAMERRRMGVATCAIREETVAGTHLDADV